jgi:uncharacterized membrane protein YfcA
MKSVSGVFLLLVMMTLPFALFGIYLHSPLPDDTVFLIFIGYLLIFGARIVLSRNKKRNPRRRS